MQQLETEHLSLTLTTKLTTSPNTKQELRMCSSERLNSSVSYWPLSWQHLQIQKILRKLWETERMSVCTLFWVEDKTRAESLYGWLCERNISDRKVTLFCSGLRIRPEQRLHLVTEDICKVTLLCSGWRIRPEQRLLPATEEIVKWHYSTLGRGQDQSRDLVTETLWERNIWEREVTLFCSGWRIRPEQRLCERKIFVY